jgi:hypothetical protein
MDFQTGMLVCKETDRSKGGELIGKEEVVNILKRCGWWGSSPQIEDG